MNIYDVERTDTTSLLSGKDVVLNMHVGTFGKNIILFDLPGGLCYDCEIEKMSDDIRLKKEE